MTKEASLIKAHKKWVARFGPDVKAFENMREAVSWLEDQKEKEREKETKGSEQFGKLC